jgi:hypothetical protein
MAGITVEPPSPSAGFLLQYSKSIAGRMMPKIKGPSGIDTAMQTALFQNRVLLYVPSTGTTGTGSGTGLGPVWTSGGTVSHPTPASTAPAISNQMRRTRYANVVTTTDQTLGIKAAAADSLSYWRGNAAGLGGFFTPQNLLWNYGLLALAGFLQDLQHQTQLMWWLQIQFLTILAGCGMTQQIQIAAQTVLTL